MIRALAILWARNEADILTWTLDHLLDQEIDVYLIENWSNDDTLAIAREFADDAKDFRVRVDRWPLVAPTTVSWAAMLRHTAQLALIEKGRGYDWILHHDADELRYSQRAGETLLEAIARLDAEGYTAIDHEVEVYKMREAWDALSYSPAHAFTEKYADHLDMHNEQIKIWKQPDTLVDLDSNAGHSVQFEGRVVAPEKLRLCHYPLRTPDQAARKVAASSYRWDKAEKEKGWHCSYDQEEIKA